MKKNQNITWKGLVRMYAETDYRLQELAQRMKETDRRMKETDRRMKETDRQMKETDRQMKRTEHLFKESWRVSQEDRRLMKKSDSKLKEENALWKQEMKELRKERDELDEKERKEGKERSKEMDEYLKELGRQVGGIAHSNGAMAEEYFYNAFRRDMAFVNESFDSIKKNLSYNNGTLEAEFDLVLFNGKSAALIEVKYNAKPDNIEIDTLISRVEVFRILFPEYAHYNIYLGVAAMSFKKGFAWRLHRAGIATIRPVGKKMVVYDKGVKVF